MLLSEITSNATSSIDVWGELGKLGLVAVLMGIAITWLVKQMSKKDKIIKAKDTQIEKDQEYIRDNDKDNLKVLSDLNQTIDKLIETQKALSDKTIDHQKNNTESLGKEIQNLKELIEVKINNITDKIDGK